MKTYFRVHRLPAQQPNPNQQEQKMEIDIPNTRSPAFILNSAPASPYPNSPSSPFSYHYCSPSNHLIGENDDEDEDDLFDFSFPSGRHHVHGSFEIATADKLFEKGRIRTLQEWGRSSSGSSSRSCRRESRSLSPKRDDGLMEKDKSSGDDPVKGRASRKWPRLKDFLLFRSASEGRVTGRGSKDLISKFTRRQSHVCFSEKNSKFGGDKKKGAAVSPHEMHYTANRAAAVEKMKKTPLPFRRHGLLGCNPFNPAINGKNRGIGCSSFSRARY